MNFTSVLDGASDDAVALEHHSVSVTYRELRDRVAAAAAQLVSLGVEPGDRVAIACANTPTFVAGFFAITHIGAVAVPLNPASPGPEIARELSVVDARAIIVGPRCAPALAGTELAVEYRLVPAGVEFADAVTIEVERPDDPPERHDASADDVAVLMFTSGTAGAPQAAELTHGNLLANLDQMGAHPGGLDDEPQIVLGALPFSHIYGLTMVLGFTLRRGGTVVLMERFDASSALAAIDDAAVTVVAGAPAMWAAFASLPEFDSAAFGSVKTAVSGAAALPPEVHAAVLERFGVDVREGYGLTEAAPAVTSAVGTEAPPGSVGRPLPGVEVRLVDESGDDALIGDAGELWVRGPNVFHGYFGADPTEDSPVDSDGWLHTGDVAIVDENGFLYLVDRQKDLIIVSGFNVHPSEVEEILRLHPGIEDAGVVGAPDANTGETVHAAVVVADGTVLEVEQVIDHCAAHLATYKCPTAVEFVDSVPRSASGKLVRRALR